MFQVASTFDAASSGNEVLLLKNNWNDRFTWITQFYVTVVDADGTRTHAHEVQRSRKNIFEGNLIKPGEIIYFAATARAPVSTKSNALAKIYLKETL